MLMSALRIVCARAGLGIESYAVLPSCLVVAGRGSGKLPFQLFAQIEAAGFNFDMENSNLAAQWLPNVDADHPVHTVR